MSRRLKVGVVGGRIGRSHIAAFQQLPDLFAVESVCDIDRERADALAAESSIPHVTTRLEEQLALDLDIVDICTPSAMHAEQALQVLGARRHVIVEKPVANCLADIDRLEEASRRSGRQVAPIFQYRFGNGYRKLLHLKARGLIGKPYVATVETHWRRTPAYYADKPWHGQWATSLGGCLVNHAIHAHDMLTEAMGPIASVFARMATRVGPIETEDCAAVVLVMESGALASLSVTLGSEQEISRLRFCFDGLTVESGGAKPYEPGDEPWHFVTTDDAAKRRIDAALADFAPSPSRWEGQFLALHHALTEDAPMPVTLAGARASIELVTAAYYSTLSGQPVELPIMPDHPFYHGWLDAMQERAR